MLKPKLIKLPIVKAAEIRRQATEGSDKPELCGNDVNDVTNPGLLRKLEAVLGFMLHLRERIARREKVRIQVDAAVRRKGEVTNLVCRLKRATHQVAASPDMFRPGHHVNCEEHTGPGQETLQAAFFDQFIAEAAETKSGLVVAEMRSGYHAKRYIGEAGAVAVAALEAEIDRPTGNQGK